MTTDAKVPSQPLYTQSSQYRRWRYSPASLRQLRQDLNQSAVSRVREKISEELQEEHKADTALDVQYLSVDDELSLVTFYLTKVPQLSKAFGFPETVASTAMTYLKRFYLNNTCMDYHPKNIMLTCLYLATKTENHVISISTFTTKIKSVTPQDVLSLEFLVAQSLRFQFKVHHAFLAAYGIFLDLQPSNDEYLTELEANYAKVAALVQHSRLGDFEFLYTPSQIALAAFYAIDPAVSSTWLFSKQSNTAELSAERLMEHVVALAEELQQFSKTNPVDLERVKQVDKRFKKRTAEAAAADLEKRSKKARADVPEDPFASTPIPD